MNDVLHGFEVQIGGTFPHMDIWFYRRIGNKTEVIEPIQPVTVRLLDDLESPEPTLRIDKRTALYMMKQVAEELEKEGINTDSQTKSEAKLEVTEKWLEDMRKLVFKKGDDEDGT